MVYLDAQEDIPTNAPNPRGKSVKVGLYVDADHAGNFLTKKSHKGIIYINNTKILWFIKRQNTVDTLNFGWNGNVISLEVKVFMLRVQLYGPDNVFCGYKLMDTNASVPTSILNKGNNYIFYDWVRNYHTYRTIRVPGIEG